MADLATRRDLVGRQVADDPLETIASAVARSARASAYAAMGMPLEWCDLLRVSFAFRDGKVEECLAIAGCPTRSTEPAELVRIDFDRAEGFSLPDCVVASIIRELEPFIISVGKIRTRHSSEGLIVLLADDWDRVDHCHDIRSLTGVATAG